MARERLVVLVTSRKGTLAAPQPIECLGGPGNGGAVGVEGAIEVQ